MGLQGAGYDVGCKFAGGRIGQARTVKTHHDHLKCCCSDTAYIPLHPQHPHRSIKDWSVSWIQIEETMKKKGVANDCAEKERICLHHLT